MKKLFFTLFLIVTAQFTVNAQSKGLSEEGYKHWVKAIARIENIKQQSDYFLVVEEFLKVLETDSLYADTYYNLGKIYTKIGEFSREISDFNKAKEYYEKYLVLNPSEKATIIKELVLLELKAEGLKTQFLLIETTLGNITIALYNETPLHRDNYIKLANGHFYDGVLFHRIIQGFMIQTGDPDSKTATKGQRLGTGGPGYTIPAEIVPSFIHKRGTVAAARMGDQVNPLRESSGSQFYIVDNLNGAPHLDGQYTIFGEVVKGLDVVDKIAAQSKDKADRPLENIKIISMKVFDK